MMAPPRLMPKRSADPRPNPSAGGRRQPMTSKAGVFRGLDTALLRVRDIDLAKQWYLEKLGFNEPYFDPAERLAVFDLGGSTSLTVWELRPGETWTPAAVPLPFPFSQSVMRARHGPC